jgi:signal transduction histidine kinase
MLPAKAQTMARKTSSNKKSKANAARHRARAAPPARAVDASLVAYAHDIRTALTGILALGELLASSNLGERERRWASSIKGTAEHLSALTTLMIDAARAETGQLALKEDVFRPLRLIEALSDSLAGRAETKGLSTELKVADRLPELLLGDAVRLRAALENLLDNAVKFTAQGLVRVEVGRARAPRGR